MVMRRVVTGIVAAAVVAAAAWAAWSRGTVGKAVDVLRPPSLEAQNAVEPDCRDNPAGPNGYVEAGQLFWGELHLHTGYSLDAFSFGTRTTPDQAYLYAKRRGDVALDPGRLPTEPAPPEAFVARPSAPLDFVALTDHSEFLSVVEACSLQDAFSPLWNTQICRRVRSRDPQIQAGIFDDMENITRDLCSGARNLAACVAEQRSAWVEIQQAAQRANRKCHFTSFVAYEWSAQLAGPGGAATNHRNVIFKNQHVPFLPFSFATQKDPPALWSALDRTCVGPCDAVTIPHNINLSAGLSLERWDLSARGVRLQQHYQVAAEIYQHKGASECHYDPTTGFSEAECAFEQLDKTETNRVDITEQSFIRYALGQGLAASFGSGLNPFTLGFVGGTDGHNGAPGNVEESTWRGHDAGEDDTPFKRLVRSRVSANGENIVHTDWGPGGITGVWARENSREAIFTAIRNRETYATSGPRIRVRVLQTPDPSACTVAAGDIRPLLTNGTPMGGTFHASNLGGNVAPRFMIAAFAAGAPQALERLGTEALPADQMGLAAIPKVQILKIHAYMTPTGPQVVTDQPYDVVANDPNAATNFNAATGGCLTWQDPSFVATEAALYYVRILQEPTFRWSYKDCVALAATPQGIAQGLTAERCRTDARNIVEERAWTSPIWYDPVAVPVPPPAVARRAN